VTEETETIFSFASPRLLRAEKGWAAFTDPAPDHLQRDAMEASVGWQDVSFSSQDRLVRTDARHQGLRHNATETSTGSLNASSSGSGHLVRGEKFEKQNFQGVEQRHGDPPGQHGDEREVP